MNRKLAATLTASLAAVSLAAVAQAAPPKGFTQNHTFTDASPDPTGNTAGSNELHCNGVLPQEKPIEVKIPGAGLVEVAISGFVGDWTLQLRDGKGEVIGGADVNPPDTEVAAVKLKKAGTVQVLPCNIGGTPQANVKITYTPKK